MSVRNILLITYLLWNISSIPSAFSQSLPPIIIENNSKHSNSSDGIVNLSISMPKAVEMMISNSQDFGGAEWENYNKAKTWKLDNDDGLKTIYIKFKDPAGKESPVFNASIFLDRKAPVAKGLVINDGSKFTNNLLKQVNLTFQVDDASEMMVSNEATFKSGRWVKYNEVLKNWILDGGDGEKVVYAKFKDPSGNESAVISGTITLDRTPPSDLKVEINEGNKLTNTAKVNLKISAKEASEIILKEENAKWVPFQENLKDIELKGVDGIKTVSLRFRDEAGNVSNPISAQITLDRKPPIAGKITIEGGATYTSNADKQVKLKIFAQEAVEMKISEDSTFSTTTWEAYRPDKIWTLSGEDGRKTVYGKFKDLAGNESELVQDDILLDRSKPANATFTINDGKSITNQPTVNLKIEAQDARLMIFSSNPTFSGTTWQKYEPSKPFVLQGADGEKFIYGQFKDAAGNVSDPVVASIILDRKPPVLPKVKINNGAAFTTDQEGKVILSLEAEDASEMMISNVSDFKGSTWQMFQPSLEWKLAGEDGLKIVGAKFRDKAGNETSVVIAKIKLAKSASVKGSIVINSDSAVTRNQYRRVDLALNAQGAKDMLIANSADLRDGKWEEFTQQKVWTLAPGDGEKTVYVRFRGFVGNESPVYSDKIVLDNTGPTDCKIRINNDSLFTINKNGEVVLHISASGASNMMISNNPIFQGAKWETYKTTRKWLLDKEDGIKTVYIKFKDEIGNESEIVSDRILLDKTPPQYVSLKINNGAEYTNNSNKAVTLVFESDDATLMRISNTPDIESAKWEKVALKKLNWILPGEDGEKRVYVQYMDEGKNVTSVVFDKIILDRKAPINCSFSINDDSLYTTNKAADVRINMKGEEAKFVLISNTPDFFGARWEAFKPVKDHWILDGPDGEKTVYMLFKDEAGNLFPDTISRKIILDRTPPRLLSTTFEQHSSDKSKILLNIKTDDAIKMELKSDQTAPSGWTDFKEKIEWNSTEGEKNIYARFKDTAGNSSEWHPLLNSQ